MADPVRDAALAAMNEHGFDPEAEKLWDEGDTSEVSEADTEDEPEDDSEQPDDSEAAEEVDGTPDDEEDEDFTESDEDSEEVPTEYFGVDLSDLPPEKRQTVIDAFKERDAEIQRAKREAASKDDDDEEDEGEYEMPSDEELMQFLGYDPEDPLYEVKAETALPIAKRMLQQEMALAEILQEREVDRFEQYWTSSIDQLEADHNIEVDRDELLDFAIENKIPDPVDAYSRFVLRGRKTVSNEAEKARAEAAKRVRERKKAATTTRPRNADTKPKKPPVGLSPEEAARRAAKELGMDWGKALIGTPD